MSKLFNPYHNSKIYKITSPQTDKFYIGSTIQSLSNRLSLHKSLYKRNILNKTSYTSSFNLMKFNDTSIELIKNVKCENRKELTKIEGQYIKEFNDKIFNISIAGRTVKEYYNDNRLAIHEYHKIYQKQYYKTHKEQFKNYYENNKERFKLYYQNNKEKIRLYYQDRKQKIKKISKKILKKNNDYLEFDNFKLEIS